MKNLLGGTIKEMMEVQMNNHLGYEKAQRSDSDDYRNGYKQKNLTTVTVPWKLIFHRIAVPLLNRRTLRSDNRIKPEEWLLSPVTYHRRPICRLFFTVSNFLWFCYTRILFSINYPSTKNQTFIKQLSNNCHGKLPAS